MTTITNSGGVHKERTAYHLVRRAQAAIAGYRNFGDGDLSVYLERDSFQSVAKRLADHYFHRSTGLALYEQVRELYLTHLVMAPILQRLPLSSKYDWHRGHLLGWFRRNATGKVRRFFFDSRIIEREYQPTLLAANLEALGIHDAGMVEVLRDLHRRHAGGTTLRDILAHQLFDPILMLEARHGYELRFGNQLFRLEKERFPAARDLRRQEVTVLDYVISSVEHGNGRHLEIGLAEDTLAEFRRAVKGIIGCAANPARKVVLLEGRIRDFAERARWARSAKPQIDELRRWLTDKLRPLAGTKPEAKLLGNLLVTLWLQRVDARLYVKAPNFFLSATKVEEKTFVNFFSPYREVTS